ncbi:haloacid dehalogenase superfamily, subfamily IA, variant 3 with third motif having DD or ED [Microbulbifer donghaiensis]|uniref:Haloacid dehalogenase superfamily, subfamily IA, variant 3 with third motif having DD or ED n=1 Tax=Microbulbifer donghaiensis TaxID=494016 RepID=A0A1M4WFS1_9GAMM|nr:HAD family phosphatase [Microbulbifer donghaiensis]SHE80088.1 haloacid dehalogenase superfamily, subfamily IA, variant 3 with third motif having DD or ED [Microbulbifer donghaiensis]
MQIKAILFDHDGTLVDSDPAHFRIWRQVLAKHGVDLSEQQYIDHYAGLPTRANAQDMIARFAIRCTVEVLTREKTIATDDYLTRSAFPPMPDALETVRHFHALGLRLAIVTGSGREVVAATTRTYRLQPLFDTLVSSDNVERNKPHPDGYLLATQRLRLSPQECLAIEDTEHGLKAAAAAGIPCLAVPNAMSRNHDFSRAEGIFAGLAELHGWVEERCFRR